MRALLLVVWLLIASTARADCLGDCLRLYGGAGDDYQSCVEDCGVCGNGDIEGDEECDDGNTESGDCCDATCHLEPEGSLCASDDDLCATCDGDGECDDDEQPALGCSEPAVAGGASLVMRSVDDEAKDALVWKWRRSHTAGSPEFGDPTAGTRYGLCIYDATGLLESITASADDGCGGRPCWSEKRGGFRYRNPEHTPDGAAQITLQHRRSGERTRIVFKAAGKNLDLPDLSGLESPVTVQLRRSGGSPVCWSARYTFSADRPRFRHRSDPPSPATTTSTTTTTTATTPGVGSPTTSSTLPDATVEVTVVDDASSPVADAEVTITYDAGQETVSDFTDDTGVVVFTAQPVGVPAVVEADDDEDRTGQSSSPGFQAGKNRLTVTVR